MLTIPLPVLSVVKNDVHCFASLWTIERTDGVVLRFTNHDTALVFEGNTYQPAGGGDASARQKRDGFQDRNLEYKGYIDDDAITHDDLRTGRYRNAKVTETTVDWRFPFLGPIGIVVYWVTTAEFDGETWKVQLMGTTVLLKQDVGRVYSRACDADLGDARCTKDLTLFTQTGTVESVDQQRKTFTATSDITYGTASTYAMGKLTWLTGANAGLTNEISNGLGYSLTLALITPFDIQVGDTFSIIYGCDKTVATCHGVFNNIVNYQGFPNVPGTDAVMAYPDAKG